MARTASPAGTPEAQIAEALATQKDVNVRITPAANRSCTPESQKRIGVELRCLGDELHV